MNGSAVPSATTALSFEEQGRQHARCMRENGIPEADPRVQPNGAVRVGEKYDKSEVDGDVLSKAIAACQRYEPVLTGADGTAKLEGARGTPGVCVPTGWRISPTRTPMAPDSHSGRSSTDPEYDQATAACRTRPHRPV